MLLGVPLEEVHEIVSLKIELFWLHIKFSTPWHGARHKIGT